MAKKILIIDDDNEYIDATKAVLEAKGYEVIFANHGKTGFEKAKAEKPDLILLDVMMDKLTEGFEVSRSFKEDEEVNTIPIILVTGIRRDLNLQFKLDSDEEFLPVRSILEKPIKPNELLAEIRKYID